MQRSKSCSCREFQDADSRRADEESCLCDRTGRISNVSGKAGCGLNVACDLRFIQEQHVVHEFLHVICEQLRGNVLAQSGLFFLIECSANFPADWVSMFDMVVW